MNNGLNSPTLARGWALWTAVVLSAIIAALHTFVQTTPTLDGLMGSNAISEAQQGLRMMWYAMSATAWTYPVTLWLVYTKPASVTRPVLGLIALWSGAQALFYLATSLWIGPDYISLPIWVLHISVGILALLARPRPIEVIAAPAPKGSRLVLFCVANAFTALVAIYHTVVGTLDLWPAELLASDIASPPKQALYAMWLSSCVLFLSIPAALMWSLKAPAVAGRFVLSYLAFLTVVIMVSWIGTKALGLSPELLPIGPPIAFGIIAALTAFSAPPRVE